MLIDRFAMVAGLSTPPTGRWVSHTNGLLIFFMLLCTFLSHHYSLLPSLLLFLHLFFVCCFVYSIDPHLLGACMSHSSSSYLLLLLLCIIILSLLAALRRHAAALLVVRSILYASSQTSRRIRSRNILRKHRCSDIQDARAEETVSKDPYA